MSNIKAIQTRYNGYKFRSRLEARWAVFFDAAQIAYEYEIEGYELAKDRWYLPDFFLPEQSVHVEVKPNMDFLKDVIAMEKLIRFGVDEDKPLVVITGTPGSHSMGILSRWTMDSWRSLADETMETVAALLYESIATHGKIEFGYLPMKKGTHILHAREEDRSSVILEAVARAREARFEHGEKG